MDIRHFEYFPLQIKAATVPTEYWGPRSESDRIGRYEANVDYITPCTDLGDHDDRYWALYGLQGLYSWLSQTVQRSPSNCSSHALLKWEIVDDIEILYCNVLSVLTLANQKSGLTRSLRVSGFNYGFCLPSKQAWKFQLKKKKGKKLEILVSQVIVSTAAIDVFIVVVCFWRTTNLTFNVSFVLNDLRYLKKKQIGFTKKYTFFVAFCDSCLTAVSLKEN